MDIATEVFRARFGREPLRAVRAPGRVNLIGEHTDYNEGFVLPVAIDKEVCVAFSPRPDREVILYSANYDSQTEFDLDQIEKDSLNPWSNYPRGVAAFLQRQGYRITGLQGVISGTVPVSAGLSSSAAIELASGWAFLVASETGISSSTPPGPLDLVHICREAENQFVGVECGIMDQFISALGQRHHALFLDCRSLAYQQIPLPDSVKLVVCNTGVKRELANSKYNQRRRECDRGVDFFRKRLGNAAALRDVTWEDFTKLSSQMDPLIRKRCRHVVSENERVKESVRLLRTGALEQFGQLMNASHQSLEYDYEVSCRELDLMVELACQQPGALGSRMTGAGFGGCTVNLVRKGCVADFVRSMERGYLKETGRSPEIYVCGTSDGAGLVR
jgi:galactokinase